MGEGARRAPDRRPPAIWSDDPFTADFARNRRLWEERLGAEVVLIPGARHYNSAEEPAVLEAVLRLAGIAAPST